MPEIPLLEYGTFTLDGSGNGTLKMKPVSGANTWLPTVASVKTSTKVKEAQCLIYIGPTTQDQYFIDGTQSGSTGDSTDRVDGHQVDTHGNFIWAAWTGGDAGAIGTMIVRGTEQVP